MGGAVSKLISGSYWHEPLEEWLDAFDEEEKQLLISVFDNLDPTQVLDVHCHVTGLGRGDTGCWVNPKMQNILNTYHFVKLRSFVRASRVLVDDADSDWNYVRNLADMFSNCFPPEPDRHQEHPKAMLLAFDYFFNEDGERDLEQSSFHVPNEYVETVVEEYPNCFEMAASIHPYREDALEQLEYWAERGIRLVKWLPNSQGIDLAHDLCVPFYEKMQELGMVLLSHTGCEHSVDSGGVNQALGNPLKLRIPLDIGLRVIAAHVATEGSGIDLDEEKEEKMVEHFELLMRLFENEAYDELLYADVSAILSVKRVGYLATLLQLQQYHHRFIFGTDYPVPAINAVISTKTLVSEGLLTEEQRTILDKLWKYNPIFFCFATMRLLEDAEGNKFQDCIFQRHPILE